MWVKTNVFSTSFPSTVPLDAVFHVQSFSAQIPEIMPWWIAYSRSNGNEHLFSLFCLGTIEPCSFLIPNRTDFLCVFALQLTWRGLIMTRTCWASLVDIQLTKLKKAIMQPSALSVPLEIWWSNSSLSTNKTGLTRVWKAFLWSFFSAVKCWTFEGLQLPWQLH